jgi:DNA-binding response OmpR family regulator
VRVLVIDDEPDVLLLCRVNLEFAGHEVVGASDAEQGLELAMRGSFDAVVLDLMLPSRDGIDVLRELTRDPATAETPVVLLTARTRADDRLRGWEAGCAAYVTKPFEPADLARTIERVHASSARERRRVRGRAIAELRRRAGTPASRGPSDRTGRMR